METKHKEFKAFDKVLVRDDYNEWYCGFYSHWSNAENNHALTSTGHYKDDNILPYEGNEHLVGTTDEPDEEVKLEEGEYIVCFDDMQYCDSIHSFGLVKFTIVNHNLFYTSDINAWKYAVRFYDFNPNDMEETFRHILCVKNGKIVKYKK